MDVWKRLDLLLDRYDGDITLDRHSESAWGGSLRLGLTNPRGRPARSIVFFAVGGSQAADVIQRLLDDAHEWLASSGVTPLRPDESNPPD
jgi:hypothetical protein